MFSSRAGGLALIAQLSMAVLGSVGAQAPARGTSPTKAQLSVAATDTANWLYATRDYSGARYAAIRQITPANAAHLAPVCAFQMGDVSNFQSNPIIVDGVMIVTTTHVTVALDARSCRAKWRHTWKPRGTSDGWLVALDLATGKEAWVRQIANPKIGETLTMPPHIYDDLVIEVSSV